MFGIILRFYNIYIKVWLLSTMHHDRSKDTRDVIDLNVD